MNKNIAAVIIGSSLSAAVASSSFSPISTTAVCITGVCALGFVFGTASVFIYDDGRGSGRQ